MDDSRVVSPEGSLDGTTVGGLLGYYTAALGNHSRHNSYSSHTSRVTYNSHAELTGRQGSREFHWRKSGPERNCHWGMVESGQESVQSSLHYPGFTNSNGHNGGLKLDAPQPVTRQRLSVQFPVRKNFSTKVSCVITSSFLLEINQSFLSDQLLNFLKLNQTNRLTNL